VLQKLWKEDLNALEELRSRELGEESD
jgi:hypothetical protein